MTPDKIRTDLIIRPLIATALMAASLWYLSSLWDARMWEQNMILIRPVVLIMIPFYIATVVFEFRRYRKELLKAEPLNDVYSAVTGGWGSPGRNQVVFIGIAAMSVVGFYILGALPATLLLIVCGLLVLGERRPMTIAVTAFVTPFVLWLVFIQLFGIRMPLFPWS